MINKIKDKKNGYILTDDSTNEEFQKIQARYKKINCIILNKNTRKRIRLGLISNNIITINNKLPDNVFYINGVC